MEGKNEIKTNGRRKKKMTGWIIALVVVAVLFGTGAVFCAPFSPVHKAIAAKCSGQTTAQTEQLKDEGKN